MGNPGSRVRACWTGSLGSGIVSGVSASTPTSTVQTKYRAAHNGVNAQKPKATHQTAPTSALKSALGCSQGLTCPLRIPLGLLSKPTKDNRAEDRRHHHTLNPLCSEVPSCHHTHRNFSINFHKLIDLTCSCCTPTLSVVDSTMNP